MKRLFIDVLGVRHPWALLRLPADERRGSVFGHGTIVQRKEGTERKRRRSP
jgi:hypothetical protein